MRLMGPALNSVTSGLYRGSIEVRVDSGGVTSINELDMDSYIRGVVAGEMPSSWPLEALKVQAVAARTYALATRKTSGVFDQYPDTRSQVYRGVTGESVRSDAAVSGYRRQDRDLRRHTRRDLLLLDLRGPYGEHRVLVRGIALEAVARGGAGSVRHAVAVPPLDRAAVGGGARSRAARAGALQADQGARARGVAARRAGAGGRHARDAQRDRPADAVGARAPGHLVHRLPRVDVLESRRDRGRAWSAAPASWLPRPPRAAGGRSSSRRRAGACVGIERAARRQLALPRRAPHVALRSLPRDSRRGPGVYRVAYGAVKGPPVRVR